MVVCVDDRRPALLERSVAHLRLQMLEHRLDALRSELRLGDRGPVDDLMAEDARDPDAAAEWPRALDVRLVIACHVGVIDPVRRAGGQ